MLALLDVLSLVLFLFRCWEEVVESPFWWIIKTPILVSILVKYQHILLAAKPSLILSVGGEGVLRSVLLMSMENALTERIPLYIECLS